MDIEKLRNRIDWTGRYPTLTVTAKEESQLRNQLTMQAWTMAVADAIKVGLPEDIIAILYGVALRSVNKLVVDTRLQHLAELLPDD